MSLPAMYLGIILLVFLAAVILEIFFKDVV